MRVPTILFTIQKNITDRRTFHCLTRAGHPIRAHKVEIRLLWPTPSWAAGTQLSGPVAGLLHR